MSMKPVPDPRELVIAISCGDPIEPSPRIPAAAHRGGGLGVLDLGSGSGAWALTALAQATPGRTQPVGVRVPPGCTATPDEVDRAGNGGVDLAVLPRDSPWQASRLSHRYRVLVEVTSVDEAREAAAAGAHGLIARGMEGGGRVSDLSSFVLLQQLVAAVDTSLPIWVAGGIGPRAAVACLIGGAAGVVLDSQLLLMPESEAPHDVRNVVRRMDGSETVLVDGYRGIRRGGPHDSDSDLLPVGQEGWLAAVYAQLWPDTAAAVRGMRATLQDALADDTAGAVLAPGGPLAEALGTRIPVAQGPMTRVSDEASFAAAVAGEGALPFVALALADAEQSRRILAGTADTLGERPWGVGVLGFAPQELRAAQLEVIREIKPRYAIIAGGRPAQAHALEADGISTFLHVPSPGLLRQFLRAGVRRFVFEGAECGGHVGPRASFPLWEAQLAVLDEHLAGNAEEDAELQVLLAGGIHDARSAAMAAAMAAGLTRRGMQIGVLMGTAYLFTREAVAHGAVRPLFHRKAIAAAGTALLETAPGHATRCLPSAFVDEFHRARSELEAAGAQGRQVWEHLELLNAGRLRIASKGLRRQDDALVPVDESVQEAEGLFMAGQAAVLRHEPTTVADLHTQVTAAAADYFQDRVAALRRNLGRPVAPQEPASAPLDIAIVGMSCILPGSPDLDGFWQTILDGVDAVTEVPADRWDVSTYYRAEVAPGQLGRVSVSKWGGFIDPVPFDALGYGIPPKTLSSIDPAQLLALEAAQRALADAGYANGGTGVDKTRVGVVFGTEAGGDMGHAQTVRTMFPAYVGEVPAELDEQLPIVTEDSFPGVLGNVIAGRIANRLDLGGPNYTVDAACASSLTALDAACKELSTGATDMMICGGADLHNGINDYLMFTAAHALSPTGRCRTFDSAGDGIALGEGVVCLVLKRLADAERAGDRIYAVVKAVGSASDGRALGLTAPRSEGQRRALNRAYSRSRLSPRQIGLIEAHGTGTVVGDRTELETLTELFTDAGAQPGSCVLGSVKSQVGHTKCAAGIAGVIKASMALYTGIKPPTINLTRPNPAWSPQRSPFAFHTSAKPWLAPASERHAGVSAFGFGGTNFHVVLSAYPHADEPVCTRRAWPAELFCFRGTDRHGAYAQIRQLTETMSTWDDSRQPWRLRDLAASVASSSGVRSGPVQVAVVARDRDELVALLGRALAGEHEPSAGLVQPQADAITSPSAGASPGRLAFLFPGQGSQRPNALVELFVAFPEIRHYLRLGTPWADLLFPPTAFEPDAARQQEDRVRDTRIAQPVLGMGGLAVSHLLHKLGVVPDLVGGHSYGELVALAAGGALDPADLLALSQERADAILTAAGADPGTMAAVSAAADQVEQILADAGLAAQVVLANFNAPTQVVLSGPTPAVEAAVTALRAAGFSASRLPVACAFHSPVVADACEQFHQLLAARPVREPAIPVWSNLTGTRYDGDASQVRRQLAEQLGSPVQFVAQIESMYAAGARVFVETGPGKVLTKLVQDILGDRPHLAVATEPDPQQGLRGFLVCLAELACAGVPVRTEWLCRGRSPAELGGGPGPAPARRQPMWTVDGQLVRDESGNAVPGGMTPSRRIKELSMSGANGAANHGPEDHEALLAEFLRSSREMIASQRDVLLAYFGGRGYSDPQAPPTGGGRPVWQSVADSQQLAPPATLQAATAVPATALESVPEPAPAAPAGLEEPASALPVVATSAVTSPALHPGEVTLPDFQTAILTVLSERTGYPVDLIELDLDLEADLSIDSIKRAEVAGEVADRLRLAVDGQESELEDLVKARTVRTMVDWLNQKAHDAVGGQSKERANGQEAAGLPSGPVVPPDPSAGARATPSATAAPAGAAVAVLERRGSAPTRLVPEPKLLAPPDRQAESDASVNMLAGTSFLVTGTGATTACLAEQLQEYGASSQIGTVEDAAAGQLAGFDGFIVLDGLTTDAAPLLPGAYSYLRQALAAGPRWLVAAGPRGGADRTDGMRGLFRTIAREYPQVSAAFVEVDQGEEPGQITRRVLAELLTAAVSPVVVHDDIGRTTFDVSPAEFGPLATAGAGPAAGDGAAAEAIGLDRDSVVVLVGGARGITPWFAQAVAAAAGCRIELVGRTPLPEGPPDPEFAAATDLAALRAALVGRGQRSPAEIERTARAILAAREVTATLAELRELGAEVRYHTLDVRDASSTRDLLRAIHAHHGRLDGLVYAAGVIEDKLIREKEPDSFSRVYQTKVEGAKAVLGALEELATPPRFVVLYGSVAAVYGSRGQSDYAAANDALDRLGARWAARTGNRCLTVHWGPWAPSEAHGGMVTEELGREYARRGIGLVDPEEGALSLLRELAWGDKRVTSVVYTAPAGDRG